MARHKSSSIATDSTESVTHPDKFDEQLRSSERLNEYYNQVVAELRASLEEIGEGSSQPS
jgi:hypothetical protein